MLLRYQHGSISLLWAALFVGGVAMAAMVVLMSTRHERNYAAEVWQYLSSGAGQKLQQAQEVIPRSVAPGNTGVRKCTVAGKLVYSNVECDASDPSTREVILQETKGFEAPKPTPDPAGKIGAESSLQDRAIEKAVGR